MIRDPGVSNRAVAPEKPDRFRFLVNNAGIGVYASVADTTEAQFDGLMSIHVKGTFFLTQKLLPLIADGGRIVNVSTGLARFAQPREDEKGAISRFTRRRRAFFYLWSRKE